MFPTHETWDVTLVDVDSDKALDLVCGNDGSSWWYQNNPADANIFPIFGQPVNSFPHATRAAATGDVDRDGALDLILGNQAQEIRIYEYDSSAFVMTPWASAWSDSVRSVALGDVDGDGYLELVCGNKAGVNRLYDNEGGVLSQYSGWESAVSRDTRSVALGDMDNDGDLDLICGNEGQSNTLYLNDGVTLDDDYFWDSMAENSTWGVALGDIDRDGFLDVVCGNDSQGNTLYLNSGGSLTNNPNIDFPAWFSPPGPTRSIALADVDSDGYLDLFCGNYGAGESLFLNTGGIFTSEPVWIANSSDHTLDIDAGDIDGDGDTDLVCGNLGEQNTIYFNKRNPVFVGDFSSPANHLPNNPTILDDVSVERVSQNQYQIQWSAYDVESDPFWLLLQYRYKDARNGFDHFFGENNPPWLPVWAGGLVGRLESSPAGVSDYFIWDVSQLSIDDRSIILRLKVIETPMKVSVVQHSMSFEHEVGPLEVQRPELSTISELVFPVVALGDTVPANFPVTNTGNEDLNISDVVRPSLEMWLEGSMSFIVPPGETHEITVFLGPRGELDISGDLHILSDAPLTPDVSIPVQTDIRALAVETQALVEGDTAPLGEALTVLVIPGEGVHIERC
jgi:hypothetical protein